VSISLGLFESGDDNKIAVSLKLDKWSFFTLAILYTIIDIIMIAVAAG